MKLLAPFVALSCCFASPALQADPPNVLIIYTDDVGYADVSAYEHSASDVSTPHIDRIAERGVLFTHGYAASPICNVSRSAVVTGQYPQSNGTRWYGGPGLTQVPVGTTLAEQLRANGYRTVSVGKHHFGSIGEPGNTDAELRTARDNPVNHGFEEFFGFIHSEKDYERSTQEDLDLFIEQLMRQSVSREEANTRARQAVVGPMIRATHNAGEPTFGREDHEGYTTDIFTDEAMRQFAKDTGKPLFLTLNYNAAHTQLWNAVPDAYLKARGVTAEELAEYSPGAYDGALPFWTFNNRYAWFNPGAGDSELGDIDDPRDTPANRFRRKLYLAAMDHLDDNIGRLLDSLQAAGQLDNTIVIFTGDNGGSHNIGADNSPLTGHKFMLGEGGIRVPFIIAWTGADAVASVNDDPVSQMDLTNTILSAAKLSNITRSDGRDLIDIVAGNADQDYRTQFWDSGNDRVVRHANWKLRVITSQRSFPNFSEEPGTFLYRLDQDPGEQNNLAKAYPALVEAMTALHADWVKQNYQSGPMSRDASLIINGSFEHAAGVNQVATGWHYEAGVGAMGATLGGALDAADGIWRAYLRGEGSFYQITEHEIKAGDTYRLRFSVNTAGTPEDGVRVALVVDDDAATHRSTDWSITAVANDSDVDAWQTYEATFEVDEHAEYLGKRVGVSVQAIGTSGYRAIDDISLTVE